MRDLTVTLVQRELAWECPRENREQIAGALASLGDSSDIVVLPEMFTTGFSMNALANAEAPGGETELWMQTIAREHDCAVTGSIAVRPKEPGDTVFNRMLFVTPTDSWYYDKRHLFRMAGEHRRYRGGTERIVVAWRGWRVLLQVCYDLRFPVFSRNREDYDLALYVANWPDSRRVHWRSLLVARAIENQACVVGVNRVGEDANGLSYSGDSLAVGADGRVLLDMADERALSSVTLSAEALSSYRTAFPFATDGDEFELTL